MLTSSLLEVVSFQVLPRCQRQGVGFALLKACTEHLDNNHLDCMVSSTAAGNRAYEKAGWRVLGESTTDYTPF
jgi:ribosomal protein S18 acetylase RimI-like enzyme